MNNDLTLPGSIPGLLRRGSPVVQCGEPALYIGPDPLSRGQTHLIVLTEQLARRGSVPIDLLALDLTDATGRAHAAWWLRITYGGVMPSCGPSWWRCDDEVSLLGWRLSHPSGRIDDNGAGSLVVWSGEGRMPFVPGHATLLVVFTLAGLDPQDPSTLPDGSRWVDAEALRRACLHVAGLTND